MTTLSSFLESVRYDLLDYETGLQFDDRELIAYLNRMIVVLDSALSAHDSEFVISTEKAINTVAYRNFVNLSAMNNGYWDSIKSVWISQTQLKKQPLSKMQTLRRSYESAPIISGTALAASTAYVIEAQGTLDFTTAGAANSVIGTRFLCSTAQTLGSGDQARALSLGQPTFWSSNGQHLEFEYDVDAIDVDFIVYYNKKNRPRLQSYSQAVTATAATDILTPAAVHTFTSGDGPFQISNSGGALPGGLSASTNYWVIYDPNLGSASFRVASSEANALAGIGIDITTTGSGTHTLAFTSSTDMMPYNGTFDGVLREFLVMYAKSKKEGQAGPSEALYSSVFNKRAFEETIRRNFVPKMYVVDF